MVGTGARSAPSSPIGTLRRRAVLRAAALGGALGAAGGWALAQPVAAAAPELQHGTITLQLRAWGWGSGVGGTETVVNKLLWEDTEPWRATHKGVNILIVPNTGGPGQIIADILAGNGPDVFHSWHPSTVFSGHYTLNLDPFIRQSNADLSVFNAAQLARFRLADGYHALPCYLGTMTLAVNEGLLDQMGLTYPAPGWTYQDFAELARRATRPSTNPAKRVYGADFGLGNLGAPSGYLPPAAVLEGFGGAYVDPSNPARCYLDSAGSVAAVEWVYGLARENIISNPNGGGSFHLNQAAMTWAPSFFLPQAAENWRSLKWSYYSMPAFPTGPATGATSDLYAINPLTKYPNLAWELLSWLSFEKTWQRRMIDLFLLSPALKSLWEEWVARVPVIAPPLQGKNLQAFAQLATGDRAFPQQGFAYESVQADALVDQWGNKIWTHQVGIREGLTQLTKAIDALEASANVVAAQQAATLRAIESVKPGPTTHYPMPPVGGIGVPATPATAWVKADAATGTYTLLGDGVDVWSTSDNCVFACLPITATEGEWVCRVTAVSNLTCMASGKPALSVWAKAGIMARGDLSDDAPMASPHVTGANQIEWEVRTIAGIYPSSDAGLVPSGVKSLMRPVGTPVANFLLAPLWLKIRRVGDQWTPFASMDGVHWTQLAPPAVAQMGGCWIGVFVLAHNGDFGAKGYIRAVFDHLNFRPTHFVQLGDEGTPPAAGPVPKDWATMKPAGA